MRPPITNGDVFGMMNASPFAAQVATTNLAGSLDTRGPYQLYLTSAPNQRGAPGIRCNDPVSVLMSNMV